MLIYSDAFDEHRLRHLFESGTELARFEYARVMTTQTNRTLFLCRALRKPVEKCWRSIKWFG